MSADRRGGRRRRAVPCTTLAVVGLVLALLMTGTPAGTPPPATPAPRLAAAEATTLTTGITVFAMWRDWLYKDQLLAKVKASGKSGTTDSRGHETLRSSAIFPVFRPLPMSWNTSNSLSVNASMEGLAERWPAAVSIIFSFIWSLA